jgi:hypothetical protein
MYNCGVAWGRPERRRPEDVDVVDYCRVDWQNTKVDVYLIPFFSKISLKGPGGKKDAKGWMMARYSRIWHMRRPSRLRPICSRLVSPEDVEMREIISWRRFQAFLRL